MTRYHGDDHYLRIADLQRTGAMTLTQIASAYGVSRTTVARWVRVAKAKGFLPPSRFPAWSEHCPTCGASKSRWQRKAVAS